MAKHVKMSRSDAPRRNELGLFMECEEEELTPSQREANLRAQTDYKSALQKIEDANTVRVPRSGSARKSMTVAASIAPMKSKSLYFLYLLVKVYLFALTLAVLGSVVSYK